MVAQLKMKERTLTIGTKLLACEAPLRIGRSKKIRAVNIPGKARIKNHWFFRHRLLIEFISEITKVVVSWDPVIIFQVPKLNSRTLFIFMNIER